jgi:hypothetical protein
MCHNARSKGSSTNSVIRAFANRQQSGPERLDVCTIEHRALQSFQPINVWTHGGQEMREAARQMPARKLRASLSLRVAISRQSLRWQKAGPIRLRWR